MIFVNFSQFRDLDYMWDLTVTISIPPRSTVLSTSKEHSNYCEFLGLHTSFTHGNSTQTWQLAVGIKRTF